MKMHPNIINNTYISIMLDKKSLLKADNSLLTIVCKKIVDPKRTVIPVIKIFFGKVTRLLKEL